MGTEMPPFKNSFRLCPGCQKTGIGPTEADRLCEVCADGIALGLGWRTVFDREAGKGQIPANLAETYPELKG
jgi:hypothetical protein